jgi:hypothetical protein
MYFSVVSDFCCGRGKRAALYFGRIAICGFRRSAGWLQIKILYKKGEKTCTKVIPWN